MSLHQLADALVHATEISRRRAADPIRFMRWLPLQHEFLSSRARVKQIRAGNQTIGKTTPMLSEIDGRCRGVHPLGGQHDYRIPPIKFWLICVSWGQSLEIQAKLWDLLPKDELAPETVYNPVTGFAPTKSPVVVYRNGSVIRIRTAGQDTIDFAGATLDGVGFDEPPKNPRLYVEALMRLEELGGVLLLSYTPINAPTEYLRKLVDEGQIEDHWRPLTPAELIPVGCTAPLRAKDGRPKDAAWIADRAAKIPEHERGVVLHGEWETRAVGAYFAPVWRPAVHVRTLHRTGRWRVLLGIDHGHQPGKQCAPLVLHREERARHRVHVLDEYVDETGTARPEDDARAILAMLGRHGLGWHQVDGVLGDRVHMQGTDSEKSNEELMRCIAEILGLPAAHLLPQIMTAKQGSGRNQGSVQAGSRWLYHQMAREDGFSIDPRCVHGIRAIERYRLVDDELGSKDWVDGLRYAVHELVFARDESPGSGVRWG